MKRECLISRLDEPNIAHLYVIESDQNLINNIRVLCTRHPETLRYFVPEELFWEIRNGEPAAMTAVCYDEYGRKLFTVDPLKVLTEQIGEGEIYLPEKEAIEIRLRVEGYDLPKDGGQTEALSRPARFMKKADSAPRRNTSRANSGGAAGYSAAGGSGAGCGSAGASGAQECGTSWSGDYDDRPMRPRRRKRSVFKAVLLAAMILAAAAGIWFLRDTSVNRFEERLSAASYADAVTIYNEEILGHESREERADPELRTAVDTVRTDYYDEKLGYEDAHAYLDILTRVKKKELSDRARKALDEVDLYEVSSATLREGVAFMEEQEYLRAIEALLRVGEDSMVYGEAQDNVDKCVGLILAAAAEPETEEECLEAIAQIDKAMELLPDNEELSDGRAACQSKYQSIVRNNAITEADELAENGDYAAAFARIEKGLEELPEDEKLQQKAEEQKKDFVDYVTREALGKVDSGDFPDAADFVEESSGIYSCEALAVLYDEIVESEDWSAPQPAQYSAKEITFTEYPGEIKGKTKKKTYSVKAEQSGVAIWEFTRMESELKAQFSVKGPDGKEIVKKTAVTDGSKLLCEFVKGEKYTAEVTATGGEGNYVLLLGQQKATVDVSDYDRVQDSIEFEDQVNNYTFAPEVSGTYRFVIESDSSDFSMSFRICDEDSKAGGGNVEDAEEVSVDMAAGKKYRIEAACSGKTCRYGFSIYRPEASRDVTGKSIICDAVLYEGQKKAYTFKAAQSGQYRITVGNMDDDCRVKLYVYSSLGDKISGEDDLGNGDSVTAEFAEGQGCQIQLTGSGGTGSYTITMAKE